METFLILNGLEISASVDEQEQVILAVASGVVGREAFTEWLQQHTPQANTAWSPRLIAASTYG